MEFGNENVRVRMEGDRISSLPDQIIHRIMSFNDTKYGVQTSVLSSRWKLVWTTLPYLKFSTDEFRILPKFFKFVNRVFSLRNHRTEVSSLDLHFNKPSQKFVQTIANYAVSHNVPKVSIFACKNKDNGDTRFPLCLFNSESLKHLSIAHDGCRFCCLPQSPWESPALTTIELHNVSLTSGNPMSLDLFSKCVSLKNLTLSSCRIVSNEFTVMKILCPRLVSLTILNCELSKYEILAPNLSSFYYKGRYPLFLSTCGLNSLEKVNLHIIRTTSSTLSNKQMRKNACAFLNIFNEFHNARFVTLQGSVVEFLSKALDFIEHRPSRFCNLKCLRIEESETLRKLSKSDFKTVINYLLNSSPNATVEVELHKDGSSESQSPEEHSGESSNNTASSYYSSADIESDGESSYSSSVGHNGIAEIGVVSGDDIDEETSCRVEAAHASEVGTGDEGQGCDHNDVRSTKLPVGRSQELSAVVPEPPATSGAAGGVGPRNASGIVSFPHSQEHDARVDVGFTQSSGSLAVRDSGRGVASTSLEENVRQGIVQPAHDLHLGTGQSSGDVRVTWRGHLVKDQYARLLTAIEKSFPGTFDKLCFRTEDMWEVALNSFGAFMSTFLSTDVEHLDDHVKVRLEGLLQDCEHFGFVIGWAFDRFSLVVKLKYESPLPRELSALDMEIAKVVSKEKALEQELASLRTKRSELEAARGAKVS